MARRTTAVREPTSSGAAHGPVRGSPFKWPRSPRRLGCYCMGRAAVALVYRWRASCDGTGEMPTGRKLCGRARERPARMTRRAGSWLALLAVSTLGMDGIGTVHAEVRIDADLAEGQEYRLVVQSYDSSLGGGDAGRREASSGLLSAGGYGRRGAAWSSRERPRASPRRREPKRCRCRVGRGWQTRSRLRWTNGSTAAGGDVWTGPARFGNDSFATPASGGVIRLS